jgi:hypothetical protein
MLVSFVIETVMASTSTKPATAALRMTPIAPSRSPTMRAAKTANPTNIAKAITDQKANGLRNVVGVAGFMRRACPRRRRNPATPATKVAMTRAGAISHRSAGCNAATMTNTRMKEIPLAMATPAAAPVAPRLVIAKVRMPAARVPGFSRVSNRALVQ